MEILLFQIKTEVGNNDDENDEENNDDDSGSILQNRQHLKELPRIIVRSMFMLMISPFTL